MEKTRISLSIIFIFLLAQGFAQQWTEPVKIVSGEGIANYKDFLIDSKGVYHCVWSRKIELHYYTIEYSKSLDQGQTWTEPETIAHEPGLWLDCPKIVADTAGMVYVSYLYNVVNPYGSQILSIRHNGYNWEPADTLSLCGSAFNYMAATPDGSVYCFWNYGTSYYSVCKYGSWSDVKVLYSDTVAIKISGLAVDNEGRIHFFAGQKKLPGIPNNKYRLAYFSMKDEVLSDIEILNNKDLYYGGGITVNSDGKPAVLWMEGINQNTQGAFWSVKEDGYWTNAKLLNTDRWLQTIIYDHLDALHFFTCIGTNSSNQVSLDHYFFVDGVIQIEKVYSANNKRGIGGINAFLRNNTISLDFSTLDTVFDNRRFSTIWLTETDITTNRTEVTYSDLCVYPNPFNNYCCISCPQKLQESSIVSIYNTCGCLVWQSEFDKKEPGFTWDGKDMANNELPMGVYFVDIRDSKENKIISTPVKIVKIN